MAPATISMVRVIFFVLETLLMRFRMTLACSGMGYAVAASGSAFFQ